MATLALPRSSPRVGGPGRIRRAIAWSLIVVGTVAYAYSALARPWHLRWGATAAELAATLPGDELTTAATVSTRAITIDAPPEAVWPWLAQIGQDKGGFYSYAWLENLLGCAIVNAEQIVPAWQNPRPGDLVKLAPNPDAPPAYVVAQVIPGRALVLGHHVDLDPARPWAETWQFVITPAGEGRSRLIVRTRGGGEPAWIFRAIEPGVFIMERGMLLGLKARAEAAPLAP